MQSITRDRGARTPPVSLVAMQSSIADACMSEIRTRRLRPGDLRRILGVSPRRAQEVFCWACGTCPNLGIESTLRLAEGLGIQPRLVLEKRAA